MKSSRPTEPFKKILVPVNITLIMNHALGYAIDIAANLYESNLIILHIIPSIPLLHPPVRHRKITSTSLTPYQEIYEQDSGATTQRILNSRMEVLEREVTGPR